MIQGFLKGRPDEEAALSLSDQEWQQIEPLLPHGRRGAHRADDWRVISGVLNMLRSGALAGLSTRIRAVHDD